MKLLVCEKPSVAQTVAKVIGAGKRCDGYLEDGGYLVSWCVGHLMELARPESYGERYVRWRKEDLPILPEEWKYRKPRKLSDEQREQSRQQDNYLQSYTEPLGQKSINSWIFPNIPLLHPSLLLTIIQVIVEKGAWLLK